MFEKTDVMAHNHRAAQQQKNITQKHRKTDTVTSREHRRETDTVTTREQRRESNTLTSSDHSRETDTVTSREQRRETESHLKGIITYTDLTCI